MLKDLWADKYKRNAILAILLALSFMIFIVFSLASIIGREESIDDYPIEGSAVDYTEYARIVGGEELVFALDGFTRFDSFAKDIKFFAEANYDEYEPGKKEVIGFEIKSDLDINGDEIRFTGNYGSVGSDIDVVLTKLNNQRLGSSISDGDINIDNQLPSNSKYNQFIATLPLYERGYSIEYIDNNPLKEIAITLYSADPALGDKAITQIEEAIGEPVDRKKISMTFPYSAGEDFR